jgi:hypothetical protein
VGALVLVYFGFALLVSWLQRTSAPVRSDDQKLLLHVEPTPQTVHGTDPFTLTVALTNLSDEPLNVLRPCGDRYVVMCRLEITGPKGQLRYTGPKATYKLGSGAFGTLKSGSEFKDELKIATSSFKGSEAPGKYRIRFIYDSTCPYHSFKELGEQYGIPDLWEGKIRAHEVVVFRWAS